MSLELEIFGARGSIPRATPDCLEFGGATSCYALDFGKRHVIFDAGSGLFALGQTIINGPRNVPIDIFFSHFHYDHMMGLPFFAPLFEQEWPVRLWCSSAFGPGALELALDRLFSAPLFPITRDMLRADVRIMDMPADAVLDLDDDIALRALALNHPGGNAAYRLETAQGIVVYSGDFEHGNAQMDAALSRFLEGADLALLDCTFTSQTYSSAIGFGHAHWEAAAAIAQASDVKRWLGVHHDYRLDDAALLAIEAELQARFPIGGLARQGHSVRLRPYSVMRKT